MPATGGLTPGFERGGGGTPSLQRIVESLGSQLGTAYDITTTTGNVYLQLMAFGRALWGAWQDNERLANQWQSTRMGDLLPRWEAIYAVVPLPTDTLPIRQARIAILQARAGYANLQTLNDTLTTLLGAVYVATTNGNSATANVYTPSGWPMGLYRDPSHPARELDRRRFLRGCCEHRSDSRRDSSRMGHGGLVQSRHPWIARILPR